MKRLLLLNGIAIFAVVLNHAAAFGHYAMFLWTHQYRPVVSPNWDQIGSIDYYILLFLRQIAVFSVPAFIFVAGYFVAYAARGTQNTVSWKVMRVKITHLLIPYIIWSTAIFFGDFLQGIPHSLIDYIRLFFTEGAVGPYSFIPLLCYLYLLTPLIILVTKRSWLIMLIVSALILICGITLYYIDPNPIKQLLIRFTHNWLPTLFLFYFVLGLIYGIRQQPFNRWLERNKLALIIALFISLLLNLIESDLRMQTTEKWGAFFGNITFVLYATTFILFFLSLDKIPFRNIFAYLGPMSLGIYFLHWTVIAIIASSIYHLLPWLLAYRVLFVPLLLAVGLGIPIIVMKLFARSPGRRYYRYLFG